LLSKVIRSDSHIKAAHFGELEAGPVLGQGMLPESHPGYAALIDDAKQKAEQIINDAMIRAQQIEQEAYQKGLQVGVDMVHAEMAQAASLIGSIAEQALEEKWRIIRSYEENVVELAVQIAEKVVDEHIELKPEAVVGIAKRACTLTAEREHVRIRVNPGDVEIMKAHKEDLMAAIDGMQKIEVVMDRRIRSGGCILETASGNVDARIQSQFGQLEQALKEVTNDE
jgi:flagellar assembly protein FliH